MLATWRLPAGVALMCAFAFALPARALASQTMESSLMDDQELIYSSPARQQEALEQIAALGVDRIKVSMVWAIVAPDAYSNTKPNFDAADPADYPASGWSRYDRLVRIAQALGLKVYFQLDPPAPDWALPSSEQNRTTNTVGRAPIMSDFQQFVQAVGTRYSGSFVPTTTTTTTTQGLPPVQLPGLPPINVPGVTSTTTTTTTVNPGGPLPRVSYWSVWNEPNIPAWLRPWYRKVPGGGSQLLAPMEYRHLLNAAWTGLRNSRHTTATDTILVGETANSGTGTVSQFVENLYCVSPTMRMLTGRAAELAACPQHDTRAEFVAANPALFGATGFAHHPYSFNAPPNKPYFLRSWITMYNLGSFEQMLNRIVGSYGQSRRGGVPLYLTEFGYESDPPNPFVKNTTAQQAAWLNEAEYMAYRDPYVKTVTQFELVDSLPNSSDKVGTYAYWARSFQTGLEFSDGDPKPAFDAYRIPIWVPDTRPGISVPVWGELRPADHYQLQYAVIEFRRSGTRSFKQLTEVSTANSQGFVSAHVAIPSAGSVRLAWLDPATGTAYYSRSVTIS